MSYERITITNNDQGWELESRCVGLDPVDMDDGYHPVCSDEDAAYLTDIVWGIYYRDLPGGLFQHVVDCPDRETAQSEINRLAAQMDGIMRDIQISSLADKMKEVTK